MDLMNKYREALCADMLCCAFEGQGQKRYLLIRAVTVQADGFVHETLQMGMGEVYHDKNASEPILVPRRFVNL